MQVIREYIGGPLDGLVIECTSLPLKVMVPVYGQSVLQTNQDDDGEGFLIGKATYRRIGDTMNYICVSE